MPWGVAAAAVSAGAGALSSSAANRQQQNATNSALAEQRRQYDTTRGDNQTGLDARNNSLARMQELAGTFGSGPTAAQVMGSPGYQFGLDQGRSALENSAAAAGTLYSGHIGRALLQYGNDYATTKYDNALNNMRNSQSDQFNRYASISGQGQMGANAINEAGQNMANNNSALYSAQGNANAANRIAQGNAYAGLANQAGSAIKSWWNQPASANAAGGANSAGFGSGAGYGNQDLGGNFADGGPVRVEPKVGTRSPLPSGGSGGGLSNNAILQMLLQKRMDRMQPQQPQGMGQLPADPALRPQAITADRMQQAEKNFSHGGVVHGPGGPRDDLIPAHLSNGEHVMDAESVTAIGGGSNEVGQQHMNKLRAMLHGSQHGR